MTAARLRKQIKTQPRPIPLSTQRKYRKAMRAAVRYVAAVQNCLESDPSFSYLKPMPRIFRDPYVQKIFAAGVTDRYSQSEL